MERSYRFRRQTLVPSTGRTYNLRRSAPFRLPRIGWIPILGLMAVVVLGWFMFGSRVFRISRVEIHGSLNDAVATQLNALKGKNLILLSTGTLESTLPREQPSIRSLHLVKGFPDTLQVDVTVRSPKLIWKVNDAVYYIDDEGIVFTFEGSAPNVDANSLAVVSDTKAQPVTVGSQLVSSAFVDFITGIATKFHDASGLTVTGIAVGETTRQVDLTTDANITVKLDTNRQLDPQLTALRLVLTQYRDSIHQYVDLRVEGKAFYQ